MTTDDQQLTERLQNAYRIEMTDDVRRRQLETISTALIVPPAVPAASAPVALHLRRRLAAIVAAVTVLSPAAVAVAAESSLPGDVLYPVKQVTEDIRSMVDPTIAARHRLEEADEMQAAGFPATVVQDVLSEADEAITIAGDPVDLRTRWMDSTARMGMDSVEGDVGVSPPVGDEPSMPPIAGVTPDHDADRMVDDTQRDAGTPTTDSGTARDATSNTGTVDDTGHGGMPPTTVPGSSVADSGTSHEDGGTPQSAPGMSGSQNGAPGQDSATGHDSSSMDTNQDDATMGGAGSGSGG